MKCFIGIVGLGFVGSAIKKSFDTRSIKTIPYDKPKNIGKIEDILSSDIIFLCLPTPFLDNYGYDISSIEEICLYLSQNNYKKLLVIKSTIEPGTVDNLIEKYNLDIVHNPEFLSARSSFEDFEKQRHIVIGVNKVSDSYNNLINFYKLNYPEANISVCKAKESELMKLFCNNFYAAKIQLFNEFYLLCESLDADYSAVKNMMLNNGWINPMHTNIGPDGQLSYGGACFPKDTNALNHLMKKIGTPNAIIDACIKERNKMRKD